MTELMKRRRALMATKKNAIAESFVPAAPAAAPGSTSTGTYAVDNNGRWVFTPTIEKWKEMNFYLVNPVEVHSGDVIEFTINYYSGSSMQGRMKLNSTKNWTNRNLDQATIGTVFSVTASSNMTLSYVGWEFNWDFDRHVTDTDITIGFLLSVNGTVIF